MCGRYGVAPTSDDERRQCYTDNRIRAANGEVEADDEVCFICPEGDTRWIQAIHGNVDREMASQSHTGTNRLQR